MSVFSNSPANAFIDIATFSELEMILYDSLSAINFFVRTHQPSVWFSQIPMLLNRSNGNPDFNTEFSFSVSRAGDYLLHSWLRVTIPAINVSSSATDCYVAWTPLLMHALVNNVSINFNDLAAHRLTNFDLDFISAFSTPAGKLDGYNEMIANVSSMTTPSKSLPEYTGILPIPLFYSDDTGVALPCASLPYNEIRVQFKFRDWKDLLTTYVLDSDGTTMTPRTVVESDLETTPSLNNNVALWANYAIVGNEQRREMGSGTQDMVIKQHQFSPTSNFTPSTNQYQTFDVRFSHSVVALFFAVRNNSVPSVWSNYTTESAKVTMGTDSNVDIEYSPGKSPVEHVSLVYENSHRLSQLPADYYTHIQPYYQPQAIIPTHLPGIKMYSYALDFVDLDSSGSTNFGKLSNVSLITEASAAAITAADAGAKYQMVITCQNRNLIRVAGGALGFPHI